MSEFETVIGLETHVQLATRAKMFCSCENRYGAPPNTLVCPVCLGLPGTLPVVNGEALRLALLAALSLGCEIPAVTRFDRKNYYYPDLPKNYQISQYDRPLARRGGMEVEFDGAVHRVPLVRLHLEEDAGKLVHVGDVSRVDLNRAGTPLVEIVTEPVIRSPAEAAAFVRQLKQHLEYLEVSDCNLQEGSLRVDANLSSRPAGETGLGVKVEIKNMNSIGFLEEALGYEARRQREILGGGGRVEQETRLWDEPSCCTRPMRGKEEAADYRYFPDPDLPLVAIDPAELDELKGALVEPPLRRRQRLVAELGLSAYDAGVLTADRRVADYFEETVACGADPKRAANWVTNEVLAHCNARLTNIRAFQIAPARLAGLVTLAGSSRVSSRLAKDVFASMLETGEGAEEALDALGGGVVRDRGRIEVLAREEIAAHPEMAASYRSGKKKAIGGFIGPIMRKSGGKADPALVREVLEELLDGEG